MCITCGYQKIKDEDFLHALHFGFSYRILRRTCPQNEHTSQRSESARRPTVFGYARSRAPDAEFSSEDAVKAARSSRFKTLPHIACMPKKNRLTGAQIRNLNPGKRLNSGLFSLLLTKGTDKQFQIACIVSKKVSSKAVVRNLVKRRMRAAIRSLPQTPPGMIALLSAKPPTATASYTQIQSDIDTLLSRAFTM
jgi:ribonuclease P protein component